MIEHIGQQQVVDMAFMGGHKNDRPPQGRALDRRQSLRIERDSVENGSEDPSDDGRIEPDPGRVQGCRDFIEIIAGLGSDLRQRELVVFSMGLHKLLEALAVQDAFFQLGARGEHWSGNALAVPADPGQDFTAQDGRLIVAAVVGHLRLR